MRSIAYEKSLRVRTSLTRSAAFMRFATYGVCAMVRSSSSSGRSPHDFTCSLVAGRARHVAVVRERGDAFQLLDLLAADQAAAEERGVTAGVDDEARREGFAARRRERRLLAAQVDADDVRLLPHDHARLVRGLHQQLVELRARHLERAVVRRRQVLVEAERVAERAVAGDELRAVLRHEVALLELLEDAEALEDVGVEREERLADLEAREALALEQQYVEAFFRQECCGGGAGGAAADDDDVVHDLS